MKGTFSSKHHSGHTADSAIELLTESDDHSDFLSPPATQDQSGKKRKAEEDSQPVGKYCPAESKRRTTDRVLANLKSGNAELVEALERMESRKLEVYGKILGPPENGETDEKISRMDGRMGTMESKIGTMDSRMDTMDGKLDRILAKIDSLV